LVERVLCKHEAAGSIPAGSIDVGHSTAPIRTPDGVADAYLTRPDGGERHPGVLFMMDAFGLRPRIEEMADRIAERGYAVLAPNLFYRAGRAPVLPFPDMTREEARGDFFKEVRPFAITGYCMGVRMGWRIAAAHPERVWALAGFHGGGLVTDDPDSPHRSAGSLRAEVYLGHADNDQSNTPEQIATLEAALDDAGVTYRSELYEGAAHGYTMADTPVYDEHASERHFGALFELLERTTMRGSGFDVGR
jgi:carboxymethylenebutenolidase